MSDDGSSLFDMHSHLGFTADALRIQQQAAARGIGLFVVTVDPGEYGRVAPLFAEAETLRVGVGLHPWWVADGRCGEAEVSLFEDYAATTPFIGEVGLDFSRRTRASREDQVRAFDRVALSCAAGGKVVSVHAVAAAGVVMDILDERRVFADNAVIFHWFSGSSDDLQWALKRGCYLSVNRRMLTSKRGREYVKATPPEHLLLETDEPSRAGEPYSCDALEDALRETLMQTAHIKGVDADEFASLIASTGKRLLALR